MLNARRQLVELALVYVLDDDAEFFRLDDDRLRQMLLRIFGNPDFIDRSAGFQRFDDRMLPADNFFLHDILH